MVAGVLWAGVGAGAEPLASVRRGEMAFGISTDGHFSLDYKGLPIVRDGFLSFANAGWKTREWEAGARYTIQPVAGEARDDGRIEVVAAENAMCAGTQGFVLTPDSLTCDTEYEVKPETSTRFAFFELFLNRDLVAGAAYEAEAGAAADSVRTVSGVLTVDDTRPGALPVIPNLVKATLNTDLGEIMLTMTSQSLTDGVADPKWLLRSTYGQTWRPVPLQTFSLFHLVDPVPDSGVKCRLSFSLRFHPAADLDTRLLVRDLEQGLKSVVGAAEAEALLGKLPAVPANRVQALQTALDEACRQWQAERQRQARSPAQPYIIPQPQEMALGAGHFVVTPGVVILAPPDLSARERTGVDTLVQELRERFGIVASVRTVTPADSALGAIVLGEPVRNPLAAACLKRWNLDVTPASPGPEGYVLHSTPDGVVVAGSDAAGTFYGIQSLIQLLRRDANGTVTVPETTIRDWPDMKWRGVHLRWATANATTEDLRRVIRQVAARYKLNCVMFGGWHDLFQWKSHPEMTPSGKGVTMDELGRTAQYARDHFLEFVPSFQAFGHVSDLRKVHPEIAEPTDANSHWNDSYCPSNPATYALLFDMWQEVIDATRPRYFHIGHDETGPIGVCDRCKGKSHKQLFADDVILIHDWLKARDVQTIMWGDMLLHTDWRTKGPFFNYAEGTTTADNPDGTDKAIDLIPKDIIVADWQYGPLPPKTAVPAAVLGGAVAFPTVSYFVGKGFRVLGCPWYDSINNYYLAETVKTSGALGMMVTDWGLAYTMSVAATSVLGAEYAWTPGRPALDRLPYVPARVLANQFRPRRPSDALDAVFTPLDIAAQANRRVTCTDDKDRTSWFGEGPAHDLRMLRGGKQTLSGMDFLLPAAPDGSGKCILLGAPGGTDVPADASIAIGQCAGSLLILTALTVSKPAVALVAVARMTARYQDGASTTMELKENLHVTDWRTYKPRLNAWHWREGYDELFGARPAFRGLTRSGEAVNLQACEWVNPHPNKTVVSLELAVTRRDPGLRLAILGVTAVAAATEPAPRHSPFGVRAFHVSLHPESRSMDWYHELIDDLARRGYTMLVIGLGGEYAPYTIPTPGLVALKRCTDEELKQLFVHARRVGLEPVMEIKILAKQQRILAQLAEQHPGLLVPGTRFRAGLLNAGYKFPDGREAFAAIDLAMIQWGLDLIAEIRPRYWLLGCDEIPVDQLAAAAKPMGLTAAELLAQCLNRATDLLLERGITPIIWGDMLLSPRLAQPGHGVVGFDHDPRFARLAPTTNPLYAEFLGETGVSTVTAMNHLRHREQIVVADWYYGPQEDGEFPSVDYFQAMGFKDVWGATWFTEENIAQFSRYAAARKCGGMMATSWHTSFSSPVRHLFYRIVNSIVYFSNPEFKPPAIAVSYRMTGRATDRAGDEQHAGVFQAPADHIVLEAPIPPDVVPEHAVARVVPNGGGAELSSPLNFDVQSRSLRGEIRIPGNLGEWPQMFDLDVHYEIKENGYLVQNLQRGALVIAAAPPPVAGDTATTALYLADFSKATPQDMAGRLFTAPGRYGGTIFLRGPTATQEPVAGALDCTWANAVYGYPAPGLWDAIQAEGVDLAVEFQVDGAIAQDKWAVLLGYGHVVSGFRVLMDTQRRIALFGKTVADGKPFCIVSPRPVAPGQWHAAKIAFSPPNLQGKRTASIQVNDDKPVTTTLSSKLVLPDLPIGFGIQFAPHLDTGVREWLAFPGSIRKIEVTQQTGAAPGR